MEEQSSKPADHPLRKPEFDHVYSDEHDSKIEGNLWYKAFIGSAFFGLVAIVLMVQGWFQVAKNDPNMPWRILGYIFVGAVVFGGLVGAVLGLRDRVLEKLRRGLPVSTFVHFVAVDGWLLLIPLIVVTVFVVAFVTL